MAERGRLSSPDPGEPAAIAVVGLACRFPGAPDARQFWANLVEGHSSVAEVPRDRFDLEAFYSEAEVDQDHLGTKWGGFVDEFHLDPTAYRMPPLAAAKASPEQLFMLDVAARSLADVGISEADLPRSRTGVFIGASNPPAAGIDYTMRSLVGHVLSDLAGIDPDVAAPVVQAVREGLPDWTEDVFAGNLSNVIAGRIANRLDLNGPSMAVDAACAASLAALQLAVGQLRSGDIDAAVVGGVDCKSDIATYMSFERTHALTSSGISRPFDRQADGIVLGEGAGAVVLMRLEDAARLDLDVRALIRGVGSSSDGWHGSLTSPTRDGQVLALQRAYEDAQIDIGTVDLFEAHGTGTAVGDATELASLATALEDTDQTRLSSLGSVKSNIGHTKTAAGIAGLIKAILAVEQRVLPPTINIEDPNPALTVEGSLRLDDRSRPWIRRPAAPRRAGVSAFGFGGANFHAVVEEYRSAGHQLNRSPRSVELFTWSGSDAEAVTADLCALRELVADHPEAALDQLGQAVVQASSSGQIRVALWVGSTGELGEALDQALGALGSGTALDTGSVLVQQSPPRDDSEVCFLFPGQGAQYPGMLDELVTGFPFAAEHFDAATEALADMLERPLGELIFPPTPLSADEKKANKAALDDTRVAQPALGAMNGFAADLLTRFGVAPAKLAGHSYGEISAVLFAGYMSLADGLRCSALRGQAAYEASVDAPGGMLAVSATAEAVEKAIADLDHELYIANYNAPAQVILAGRNDGLAAAASALNEDGLPSRRVAITAPFHSPLVGAVVERVQSDLDQFERYPLQIPVYGDATAKPLDPEVEAVNQSLVELSVAPVRFVELLQQMHDDGGRVFVEVGPSRIISALVKRCLDGRDFDVLTVDGQKGASMRSLAELIGRLHTLGVSVDPTAWYDGRGLAAAGIEQYRAELAAAQVTRPTDLIVGASAVRGVEEPSLTVAEPSDRATVSLEDVAALAGGQDRPAQAVSLEEHHEMSIPPQPSSNIESALLSWIELQREQTRLLERMVALHEAALGQGPPTVPAQAPAAVAQAPAAVPAAPPVAVPAIAVQPLVAAPDAVIATSEAQGISEAQGNGAHGATVTERPASTAPAEADNGSDSLSQFRRDLLDEVMSHTGYPEDMLDLDLPLESGLGIDSIKVLEIFGGLSKYHRDLLGDEPPDEQLAEFVQLETLRDILDAFEGKIQRDPGGGIPARPFDLSGLAATESSQSAAETVADPLERAALTAVPRPEPELDAAESLDSDLLFVGDGTARAEGIAAGLRQRGAHVHSAEWGKLDALADIDVDLDGVVFWVGEDAAVAVEEFGAARVVATYEFMQALSKRLVAATEVHVVAVSEIDGRHGLAQAGLPEQAAALAGPGAALRTLAAEFTSLRVRALDLAPDLPPASAIDELVAVLSGTAGSAEEIGRDTEGSWELELQPTASAAVPNEPLIPTRGVVLAIGGGRGITAGLLIQLASNSPSRIVLIGRTDPSETGPPELAELSEPNELRAGLIELLRATNPEVKPAEVELELAKLLRAREVAETLRALADAGAEVEYCIVDATDAPSLAATIRAAYERYGRIDCVIHAAGVNHDRPLARKTAEEIRRSYLAKAVPAQVLAAELRPDGLRSVLLFGSMAARVANAEQGDYAAANRFLELWAIQQNAVWDAQVRTLAWSAWDDGMVSQTLADAAARIGVRMITESSGGAAFLSELAAADPQPAIVGLGHDLDRLQTLAREFTLSKILIGQP